MEDKKELNNRFDTEKLFNDFTSNPIISAEESTYSLPLTIITPLISEQINEIFGKFYDLFIANSASDQ